jgi:hypothetical protein
MGDKCLLRPLDHFYEFLHSVHNDLLSLGSGRARRQPPVVIFDQLAITVGRVAVVERAGAVVAELRLKSPRKLKLYLAQGIYHFVLEQSELIGVAEDVGVEFAELFDGAVQLAREVRVAPERASKVFCFLQSLAKLALKLA